MEETAVKVLSQLGDGPEEEKLINEIGRNFDKLQFDTKINIISALRDHISIFIGFIRNR